MNRFCIYDEGSSIRCVDVRNAAKLELDEARVLLAEKRCYFILDEEVLAVRAIKPALVLNTSLCVVGLVHGHPRIGFVCADKELLEEES